MTTSLNHNLNDKFLVLFCLNSQVFVEAESGLNVLTSMNVYDHGDGRFTVECWFSIFYTPDSYGWFNWGHSSGQPTENDGKSFLTAMTISSTNIFIK